MEFIYTTHVLIILAHVIISEKPHKMNRSVLSRSVLGSIEQNVGKFADHDSDFIANEKLFDHNFTTLPRKIVGTFKAIFDSVYYSVRRT